MTDGYVTIDEEVEDQDVSKSNTMKVCDSLHQEK